MLAPQVQTDPPLSLSVSVLEEILEHAKPLGHHEEPDNLNLGFGFVYYGLVRALRPRHILVIGSGFGFSVVCLALGQKDNGRGTLTFVDPSYSVFREGPLRTVGGTAYWDDPRKVRAHFKRFGVERIVTHHKLTSAQLFEDYRCAQAAADRPRLHRRQPRLQRRAQRLPRRVAARSSQQLRAAARHEHLCPRARASRGRQALG